MQSTLSKSFITAKKIPLQPQKNVSLFDTTPWTAEQGQYNSFYFGFFIYGGFYISKTFLEARKAISKICHIIIMLSGGAGREEHHHARIQRGA